MKCNKCNYEWKPRKKDPVSCPRCKRRFDYKKLEAEQEAIKRENERLNKMTQSKGGKE